MPLPIRTIRVFPNPWEHWTLENGPQGALAFSGSRNVGPLRYVGAVPKINVRAMRDEGDPRGNDTKYSFTYPGLNPELTDGTPIDLPIGDAFWHDRLHDGSLIPGDAATLRAFPDARFKSLTEARAACIADFEAHYGPGTFAEAFAGKPFVPAESASGAARGSVATSLTAPPVVPVAVPTDDATSKSTKGGKS